jgi:hypothetical protein
LRPRLIDELIKVATGFDPGNLAVFDTVVLEALFDGASAFGLSGGATDTNHQATDLAPAAAYREQDLRVRRVTLCWHHRDDLWHESLLHGHVGGDSPHFRQ